MKEVVIISAVRTPIGSFGGCFANISATFTREIHSNLSMFSSFLAVKTRRNSKFSLNRNTPPGICHPGP